jgi:hypothetical protein
MILPTKHVPADRALIGVGAEILRILNRPMTMSKLWDEMRNRRNLQSAAPAIDYQWFVLSLDLLYIMCAIDFDRGLIRRASP